ncbi:MAG TPA: pyridoxamine 5'-phosphate oxidase family protein [Streptosporangiaceae bacterium]|jgi:hypothetical protein
MGKVYAGLDDRLRHFIVQQSVFFVATAPSCSDGSDGGHVNVSPKGYRDTFAVLGPTTVAYLDLTGSGAETIAHLRQNARITIMFCSFDRTPKVLRLYGSGRVVRPGDRDWDPLSVCFPAEAGSGPDGHRAIIVAELDRVSDSCGYAVPVMELREERDLLTQWTERKTPAQLEEYQVKRNAASIDGLPALDPVRAHERNA